MYFNLKKFISFKVITESSNKIGGNTRLTHQLCAKLFPQTMCIRPKFFPFFHTQTRHFQFQSLFSLTHQWRRCSSNFIHHHFGIFKIVSFTFKFISFFIIFIFIFFYEF
uniref:Transmembrane protein n=1 Tax=Medicago truncatula TaxID=3880 RepID=I3S3P2_MEDTR|nr:unknown [Medicago truncatula]